ncbi:MAG TPA: SRPBCC family protein, partial [Steroidobacteraceae bacterium]|nr:SRPBCC family protein [Steroidobacteraceae bacterium]
MIAAIVSGENRMRFVRAVLIGLVILALVVLAAGLFLPKTAHVERSILIDAPPAAIYDVVSNLRRFNEWSPWYERDPDARYEYTGPERGVGAKMSWTSAQADVGSGSQEIIAADPDRAVTTRLDFG